MTTCVPSHHPDAYADTWAERARLFRARGGYALRQAACAPRAQTRPYWRWIVAENERRECAVCATWLAGDVERAAEAFADYMGFVVGQGPGRIPKWRLYAELRRWLKEQGLESALCRIVRHG